MTLADLQPAFLKILSPTSWRHDGISCGEADGIAFLCPVCYRTNKGPVGTHTIICWRPHVSREMSPGPGRWEFHGTSFADLSLVAGSSSVLLNSGCRAHFFVRHGQIEIC